MYQDRHGMLHVHVRRHVPLSCGSSARIYDSHEMPRCSTFEKKKSPKRNITIIRFERINATYLE